MRPLTCRCGLTLAEHHANYGCKRTGRDEYEEALYQFQEWLKTWGPQPVAAELPVVVINEERRTA